MVEEDKKLLEINKKAKEDTNNIIFNFFSSKQKKIYSLETDNDLYNAIAFLCNEKKIDLIPYSELKNIDAEKLDIRNIARLSHFPIRKIKLEDNWNKKECGNFLGYYLNDKEESIPVAIIQLTPKKYGMFNPKEGRIIRVTEEIAERISSEAYVIYRSLGKDELNTFGLFKFAIKELRIRDCILFLVLLAACTLIGLLLPVLNSLVFDDYLSFHDFSPIIAICSVMLVFNIAAVVFDVIKGYVYTRISISIEISVQQAVYDRLIHLPSSFLRSHDGADLAKRVMDIMVIFNLLFNVIIASAITVIFSLSYIYTMLIYAPSLAGPGIIVTAVSVVLILPFLFFQRRYARSQFDIDAKLSGVSWQMIAGIEKIKGAGAENRATLQYMKNYERSRYNTNVITMLSQNIALIRLIFSTIITIVFYSIAAHDSEVTLGAYTAFTTSFNVFNISIMSFLEALSNSSSLKPTIDKLNLILKTKPDYSDKGIIIDDLEGRIEVKNISFAYNEESPEVLKDISFSIKKGEYIGIVGTSGSGKSTLLRLLLGLDDPKKGAIYYDDINIETLDKQNLRTKMGVVLQNDKVFAGSIKDNLTFTTSHASPELIDSTIKKVGLEGDIKNMPMGIHTYVTDGGGTLSGGQQQRVLIARAIMSNPKVIFFDEATSALDNIKQSMVCETLKELDATKIVIAHRLTTVQDCDRILVMDNGKIAEEGSFKELMDKKGIFYSLAIRQIAEDGF